ncbi:hypothetical protein BSKO_06475 [Bryopsis sp. KO-2023]|nr:hypothetical protein BSKO_06475 [Bryopsis sp. KO-2023]
MSHTSTLWISVLATVLGAFQYGYVTGVLNTILGKLAEELSFDETVMGAGVVSIALLGAAFGATLGGRAGDSLGLKSATIYSAGGSVIGSVMCALSPSAASTGNVPWILLLGRLIQGLGAGAGMVYTPRYIGEISPPSMRGRLGSLVQIFCNVGILGSYIVGLPYEYGMEHTHMFSMEISWWRVMLAIGAIGSLMQIVMMNCAPESPVWLEWKGKHDSAEAVRVKLYGPANDRRAEEKKALLEVDDMEEGECDIKELSGKSEGLSCILRRRYRWMVVLAIGVLMLQQLSGINTVVMYSSTVFASAGMSNPIFSSILTGVMNLLMTIVASPLLDRYGRRPMMLWSMGGMAFGLLGLSMATSGLVAGPWSKNASLGFVLLYMAFFAIGAGPVPWIYVAEVLPANIKGSVAGFATGLSWVACLIIGLTFPIMLKAMSLFGTYLAYGLLNVLGFAFVYVLMIETKQQTLQGIVSKLMLSD